MGGRLETGGVHLRFLITSKEEQEVGEEDPASPQMVHVSFPPPPRCPTVSLPL